MEALIGLIVGAIGGFAVHSISMNVSFKHRTIDNKIKVYDGLISHWVRMRNFIYAKCPFGSGALPPEIAFEFDQIYGGSQTMIGEVFLICEDVPLATRINDLNERLYRTQWYEMNLLDANNIMESIKIEAIVLISEMRRDIKKSTRFDKSDFFNMVSGLWRAPEN